MLVEAACFSTVDTDGIKHFDSVNCANAFRMDGRNSSAIKSFACTCVAFLAGIISLSVDSTMGYI
jgi:hypothetical protein